MFSINKDGSNLSLTSVEDESISGSTNRLIVSSNSKDGRETRSRHALDRSEQNFPTIEESQQHSNIITQNLVIDPNPAEPIQDPHFSMILIEQVINAAAIFYLTISLVASMVFLSRQISNSIKVANITWYWTGLAKAALTISIAIITIFYKIYCHKNVIFIERIQSANSLFFYACVVAPSTAPCIYYLIIEIRNIKYSDLRCTIAPDLMIPITQMLFIANVVIIVSDLTFYRIKDNVPKKFFNIYLATVTLVLSNCATSLLFNFCDVGSQFIRQRSKFNNNFNCSNPDYYFSWDSNAGPFLQIFITIFFVSAMIIIINTIRKLPKLVLDKVKIELSTTLSLYNHEYSSTSLVLALMFCIASIIVVPLDYMGKDNHDTEYIFQLLFYSVHLCIYIIVSVFSVLVLTLFRKFLKNQYKEETSRIDKFIIWVSLFGQIMSSCQNIINSSQFLYEGVNVHKCNNTTSTVYTSLGNCLAVHSVVIVSRIGNIVQSLLQAVVLNFINHLNINVKIEESAFEKICYPLVIILASNFGFCVSDVYLISGFSTFTTYPDNFNKIVWDLFGTIGDPFTILFRGYCILYLLQFLSKLKCTKS